jgi:Ca2+-transporting ATPase
MIPNHENYYQSGLSEEEVRLSREKYGVNLLTPPKRPSLWKLYLEKFEDPVIRVLLVAALFSLVISIIENEYAETIGIIAAILLATGIGFYFEYDAGRKFDLLNVVNEETPVKVIRSGRIREIPRKEVVVGDIVILETGDEIPADGELIASMSMQVNESNLTGEPVVGKTTVEAFFDEEATYASNRVMRGTTVVDGHGTMKALHVGDATEIGNVAKQSTAETHEPTPLNLQLTKLAKLIGRIGFTVAIAAFVIFTTKDLYHYFSVNGAAEGMDDYMDIARIVLKYFMMAVTLIVVAVPEGLPMSVTLSLALNMRRMLATNNLVRKMHASETMGAITVICTDKTGTLTRNRMQVYEPKFYGLRNGSELNKGNISRLIIEGIGLNSTAFLEEESPDAEPKAIGNPTEAALLLWLRSNGCDYVALRDEAEVIDRLPFSTERKFMATIVNSPLTGKKTLYVKGAPEIVLAKCKEVVLEEGVEPVSAYRPKVEEQLLAWQGMAMRTLGFAYKVLDDGAAVDCAQAAETNDLSFLGVVAISDPVRPDVPDAVAKCRAAGIDIKIVTGDTPGTATEIARRIGLWTPEDTDRNRLSGTEFAALSDEEALERVMDIKVMSRARPTDKQRLVQLLQQKGAVVAVTGDGTNDAPALNHAQIGLSMGTGTSVAKEASDITLLDDSFRSIGTAVMWGRSLYKNIQRFIVFQLTINFVALLTVLLGSMIGTALPLTVTQMLWVNLIMDTFAALALASIPPSESVMKDQPRKHTDFIITRPMAYHIFGVGTAFLVTLMGMLYFYAHSGEGMTDQRLTIFFTFFVMLQCWNLFNARVFGTTDSVFKGFTKGLTGSYGMKLVILAILLGQFLIVQFGGAVFRTEPLSLNTWITILTLSSIVLWIGELIRLVQRLYKNKTFN